jgi:hypothetical protein
MQITTNMLEHILVDYQYGGVVWERLDPILKRKVLPVKM